MRRLLCEVAVLCPVLLVAPCRAAAQASPDTTLPTSLRIWKGTAPGSDARHWPRPDYHEEWEKPGELLRNVTDPSVQVFLPASGVNTGAAVIVCPGGRYQNLYIAHEGWDVARELQKRGIAAIVLKYRHYNLLAAAQDAQRAVRFVRAHAAEWRINPRAVGIGGFSAGGHLSLNMARLLAQPEPWPHDEVDGLSRRPDFLMLIYPAVANLSPGGVMDASFPPAFIALANGDWHTPPGPTIGVYNRLVALGVPTELHIYQQGGHGFGPGTPECHCASWLDLFRDWLDARGLLGRPVAAR